MVIIQLIQVDLRFEARSTCLCFVLQPDWGRFVVAIFLLLGQRCHVVVGVQVCGVRLMAQENGLLHCDLVRVCLVVALPTHVVLDKG